LRPHVECSEPDFHDRHQSARLPMARRGLDATRLGGQPTVANNALRMAAPCRRLLTLPSAQEELP
jgi:hypothetical protein